MLRPLRIEKCRKYAPRSLSRGAFPLLAFVAIGSVFAYERYNDGCVECHGAFTDATSTKGSVFPQNSKHEMHRGDAWPDGTRGMNTECNLCHTSGDQKNPFIGSSNGTANNLGLGCTGCHTVGGLRTHHLANNVVDSNGEDCSDCHAVPAPIPENVDPPYYGTPDTRADNACNDVLQAEVNENWTIGDFVGLDNDGDNLYDLADFGCGPPNEIVTLVREGDNVRIIWVTVGGRRDTLQATSDLSIPFANVGSAIDVPGVGVVTQDAVEVDGATASSRFYRIESTAPVP